MRRNEAQYFFSFLILFLLFFGPIVCYLILRRRGHELAAKWGGLLRPNVYIFILPLWGVWLPQILYLCAERVFSHIPFPRSPFPLSTLSSFPFPLFRPFPLIHSFYPFLFIHKRPSFSLTHSLTRIPNTYLSYPTYPTYAPN